MKYLHLPNGVSMPAQMAGTPGVGRKRGLYQKFEKALACMVSLDQVGYDSARDYKDDEKALGSILSRMFRNKITTRDKVFITTKVGNGQQRIGNMRKEIDISLKALKTDYVDLWLLHWPLPDYWLDNWAQMQDIYRSGKVRAIGIANLRERHIAELKHAGLPMPHVVQVEYHPFRTIPAFVELCRQEHIQLEAYTSNCMMLPFVLNNPTLRDLALKYDKTVAQIIMRWHIQQEDIPVFRSLNLKHIRENVSIYNFSLTEEDMRRISALDTDYKFHPESLNCPGY